MKLYYLFARVYKTIIVCTITKEWVPLMPRIKLYDPPSGSSLDCDTNAACKRIPQCSLQVKRNFDSLDSASIATVLVFMQYHSTSPDSPTPGLSGNPEKTLTATFLGRVL